MLKKIVSYSVSKDGGTITAPTKVVFLAPYMQEDHLVLPVVQDPEIGPGVYDILSPIVDWSIRVCSSDGEIEGNAEYVGTAWQGEGPRHVFVRRSPI